MATSMWSKGPLTEVKVQVPVFPEPRVSVTVT